MTEPSPEQIRAFRLRAHHLDRAYPKEDIVELARGCGMQNTPPGAWETAVHCRVPDCTIQEPERLLYKEKSLLQAWSFRGAPVVFPADESAVFLSSLAPVEGEPWVYTAGIALALDILQMSLEELLAMLVQTMPRLDGEVIVSKSALDQTLAQWMLPLVPTAKRELWNSPSVYGSPDKQTIGGAVVSFLLRPCAFKGLVVFGERSGVSPTFTSYRGWTGHPLPPHAEAGKKLVRGYLHCYGPSTVDNFVNWLGCSPQQGKRLWSAVGDELENVTVAGKKAFILAEDRINLFSKPDFGREWLLLGGHDPYLDQRDRAVLQSDKGLQRKIWTMVTNPGAVVCEGEVVGIWNSRKKSSGIEIKFTLWETPGEQQKLYDMAESYAAFRRQKLLRVEL